MGTRRELDLGRDDVRGGAERREVGGVSGAGVGRDEMYVASSVIWMWASRESRMSGGFSGSAGESGEGCSMRTVR